MTVHDASTVIILYNTFLYQDIKNIFIYVIFIKGIL